MKNNFLPYLNLIQYFKCWLAFYPDQNLNCTKIYFHTWNGYIHFAFQIQVRMVSETLLKRERGAAMCAPWEARKGQELAC